MGGRKGVSYNIQDLRTGQSSWVNMREYTNFRRIPEEEEVLLEEFDERQIIENKMQEINSVFDEVENEGQKTINARWIIRES